METINCPICNQFNDNPHIQLSDRLAQKEEKFTVVKCECGLQYLNPRPDNLKIKEYYQSEEYDPFTHKDHSKLYQSIYLFIQYFAFKNKKRLIEKYSKNATKDILDYGSGSGEFASYIKRKNWNVYIYEPNDVSNQYNLQKIDVLKNNKIKFDIMTFWHSLEHIHDLDEVFTFISTNLKENGTVFFSLPNIDAIEKKYFKEDWAPYDAPRHLYHFNIDTFKQLLSKHGFNLIKLKTLYQDTPYNIMLSLKTMKILKTIFYSILSLSTIFFINKKKSSSFLFVCKKQ